MPLPSWNMQASSGPRLRGLAALALFASAPALAQGTIAGTVITEGTNAPVPSAQVTVIGQNFGRSPMPRAGFV